MLSLEVKRVFVLGGPDAVRAALAEPAARSCCPRAAPSCVGAVIYDKDKTTFRSEIDQALRAKPDMIYLNGYTPD